MKLDYLYYYWECKAKGKRAMSYNFWLAEQNLIQAFGGPNLFSKAKK